MFFLGLIGGAALTASAVILADCRSAQRAHAEYLREWQKAQNAWRGILRTRHRRADRYKDYAPLPMDLYKQQMKQAKCARLKRIDGRWSA